MTWKNIQDILVEGKSRFPKHKHNVSSYLEIENTVCMCTYMGTLYLHGETPGHWSLFG
jgi:hypothetical protein